MYEGLDMGITYTWIIVFALIGLGGVSGFISVLAGGGVTVILPMLLAIGLNSAVANGTSRVSLTVGAILATYSLYRKQVIDWTSIWPLLMLSALGSVLGSYAATFFSITVTSDIILITCIVSFILISTKPNQWLKPYQIDNLSVTIPRWFYGVYFLLCFYGGVIAVDSAILRLAALVLLISLPLNEANAIKVVTGLPLFLISAFVFFVRGDVDYQSAGYLSIGTMVGALVATRYMNHPKTRILAYALLYIVVVIGTIYLLWINDGFILSIIDVVLK